MAFAGRLGYHIDHSQVGKLVVDLQRAPLRVKDAAADAFKDEADQLHRDMRQRARGHRYLPKLPRTLTRRKLDDLDYTVGFNFRGQGHLAHIVLYPSGGARNAPIYDFTADLRRRGPKFVEYLADVCEDAVFRSSR